MALPHLDAAYNLARWLLRDEHAADDVVQEAFMRALRYFGSFRGDDPKPWLLGIVRNSCFTWLRDNRGAAEVLEYDEEGDGESVEEGTLHANDPVQALSDKQDAARLNAALAQLAPLFREVLILRELEDLSYSDIARVAGIPIGTVMSRLSRARTLLRRMLLQDLKGTCDEHAR